MCWDQHRPLLEWFFKGYASLSLPFWFFSMPIECGGRILKQQGFQAHLMGAVD